MAKRERAKFNIPMVVACVLLCLTLFSLHFTSDIYARYTTQADGKDNAKVASFGNITLVESGDFANAEKTAEIIPGDENLTKNAKVSFSGSEVAVYIIVEAELSDHWTTADNRTFSVRKGDEVQLEWSVADDWTFIANSGTDRRYAYYKELDPNDVLTSSEIVKNGGKITVSEFIDRFEIKDLTGIKISFRAYAVQKGDLTPEQAWSKVK